MFQYSRKNEFLHRSSKKELILEYSWINPQNPKEKGRGRRMIDAYISDLYFHFAVGTARILRRDRFRPVCGIRVNRLPVKNASVSRSHRFFFFFFSTRCENISEFLFEARFRFRSLAALGFIVDQPSVKDEAMTERKTRDRRHLIRETSEMYLTLAMIPKIRRDSPYVASSPVPSAFLES